MGTDAAPNADSETRSIRKAVGHAEATPQPIVRRRALLVGVSKYKNYRDLKYPGNDIIEFENFLKTRCGYEDVVCIFDQNRHPLQQPDASIIKEAVQKFCNDSKPDDLIWVHFSCHGERVADEQGNEVKVLVARDTDCNDLIETAVHVERDVHAVLARCNARQKVLSLDACRMGSAQGARSNHDSSKELIFNHAQGIAVLAASRAWEDAHESANVQHGLFTEALLAVLAQQVSANHRATLKETANLVLKHVIERAKSEKKRLQQPTLNFDGLGDFLLVDLTFPKNVDNKNISPGMAESLLIREYPIRSKADSLQNNKYYANHIADQLERNDTVLPPVIVTLYSFRIREDREAAGKAVSDYRLLAHSAFPKFINRGTANDGRPYYVTEHLLGKYLYKAMKSEEFSCRQIMEHVHELVGAIRAAHKADLVHADLNPHKILVTPVGWRILDLPLAAIEVHRRLRESPGSQRSPYWAPEVGRDDQRPTGASDVYSLGVLLHELLNFAPSRGESAYSAAPAELLELINAMREDEADLRPTIKQVELKLAALTKRRPSATLRPIEAIQRRKALTARIAGLSLLGVALVLGGGWLWKRPAETLIRPDLGAPFLVKIRLPEHVSPAELKRPLEATLEGQARAILLDAMGQREDILVAQEAANRVGWLRDSLFMPPLLNLVRNAKAAIPVRSAAAHALGLSGLPDEDHQKTVDSLLVLLKDAGTDIRLWREALAAACQLSTPAAVMERLGPKLLTESSDGQRKREACQQFAPSDAQAKKFMAGLAAKQPKAFKDPQAAAANVHVLLSQVRDLNQRAVRALASMLKPAASPSRPQVELAIALASVGDLTGVDVLDKFVRHAHDRGGDPDLLEAARRQLARLHPTVQQCNEAAQALRGLAANSEAAKVALDTPSHLITLPLCQSPEEHVERLRALLPSKLFAPGTDPLLGVHVAATLLQILSQRAAVSRRAPSAQPSDSSKALVANLSSQDLTRKYVGDLRRATDHSASPAERSAAARHVQEDRNELEKRKPAEPEVASALASPAVQEREGEIRAGRASADPLDTIIYIYSEKDPKALEELLQKEQRPAVRQAVAERLATPDALDVLKRSAQGTGVLALRAYGELRRRQPKEEFPRPPVNLLALYTKGRPDERLELVEALGGWAFDEIRAVLVAATKDGVVDVRRSTVRLIGEAAANADTELKALLVLRLMFGDSDALVHKYIQAILQGRKMPASQLPRLTLDVAPEPAVVAYNPVAKPHVERPILPPEPKPTPEPSPPPPPPPVADCVIALSADDRDVEATLDDRRLTLPTERTVKPGKYRLHTSDAHGDVVSQDVTCLGGERSTVSVPVSVLGQRLVAGIQQWEKGDADAAHAILDDLRSRAESVKRSAAGDRATRAADVWARSSYYLGLWFLRAGGRPTAITHFQEYLNSRSARDPRNQKLTEDAKRQVEQLKPKLGRFSVRLLLNGTCQLIETWQEPGQGKSISINVGNGKSKEFSPVTIYAQETTLGEGNCQ